MPLNHHSLSSRLRVASVAVCIATLFASAGRAENLDTASTSGWISLFNGKNLDGWTVKVAKHPLGENPDGLFRAEDGVLKVAYDDFAPFNGRFAHLYTNNAYSRYVLRLEYRFTGEAAADAPHWAKRNSGVMVHSQSPLTLGLGQSFPVSVECQFLVTGTTAGNQTGNVCTPGTHVEHDGALTTAHIIEAEGDLSPWDEWVTAEIEVRGHDEIIHRINGVEVLRTQHPQLDPSDPDAAALLAAGVPLQLGFGHIALQAESQPIWFRNIMLRPLE